MKLPLSKFAEVIAALKEAAVSGSNAEKRTASRMNVCARIDVIQVQSARIEKSFNALTRDISLSGIGLLQTIPLQQGREVILVLPRKGSPLLVAALVMHCRTMAEGILAVGLVFDHIIDEPAIKRLMASDTEQVERLRRSILE